MWHIFCGASQFKSLFLFSTRTHARTHAHTHAHTHTHTHTRAHTHMHKDTCTHTHALTHTALNTVICILHNNLYQLKSLIFVMTYIDYVNWVMLSLTNTRVPFYYLSIVQKFFKSSVSTPTLVVYFLWQVFFFCIYSAIVALDTR